jgi:ubiquinone/menaquinone biosynthesis C-methylase UbiE
VRERLSRGLRRTVTKWLSLLPSPRDKAALNLLRSLRDLLEGREPQVKESPPAPATERAEHLPFGAPPGPPLPPVDPIPADHTWKSPPPVEIGDVIRRLGDAESRHEHFDADLLDELNAEYASKPIAPSPRDYAPSSMFEAAHRRVRWAHNHVDLRGKDVLEIGCGSGVESWTIANNLDARVHGVDVIETSSWEKLRGERCEFSCVDLAQESPFAANSFDRIVSFTVWEHVRHPHALLEETFRILKPGGLQWLRANLYAGPMASHRYREIYFPWPHLLFSDDVVREWDRKHGRPPRGLSWVNHLSMYHYRAYFADVGFRLRYLRLQNADFDQEFYERFEDVLGKFPRTDLSQDFFLAVLEKPA